MKTLRNLLIAISKADFFNSTQLLRYDKQNDYRTLTGGFISLAIVAIIIVGFANMIMDTFTRKNLLYQAESYESANSAPVHFTTGPQDYFMVSFSLSGFGLTDYNR